MKILEHQTGKPQEPVCPACSLGASGFVITDSDADDPCALLSQLNLAYWVEDVNGYMKGCLTAPASTPERDTLTVALALRGAGASRATAESMVLRMRDETPLPVLSVAKTRKLIARAYEPDGAEWQGLRATLGRHIATNAARPLA